MENEHPSMGTPKKQAATTVPERNESPERQPLGITIEITFTDVLGRLEATFNGPVEQFPARKPGADYIEGYIRTPYGDYILTDNIRWSAANDVFKEVKRHVEAKNQYKIVEAELRRMKDMLAAAVRSYQYGTGDPDYELSGRVSDLVEVEKRLKGEIDSLDQLLRPYR